MGVARYKLLGENDEVLYKNERNTCFANFIPTSYTQPPVEDFKRAVTMVLTVNGDYEIDAKFIKTKLIQALCPGIKRKSKKVVEIPLVGVPFDQIICALRLMKGSSLLNVVGDFCGIVDDSVPAFFCFTMDDLKAYYKADKTKYIRDGYNGFNLVTDRRFKLFLEKRYGASAFNLSASAYPALLAGNINQGVLPEYSCGEGYNKWYSILTTQMVREGFEIKGGQAGVTDQFASYYDGKHITVNEPLVVPDFELAKVLQEKFPLVGEDWAQRAACVQYLKDTYGE